MCFTSTHSGMQTSQVRPRIFGYINRNKILCSSFIIVGWIMRSLIMCSCQVWPTGRPYVAFGDLIIWASRLGWCWNWLRFPATTIPGGRNNWCSSQWDISTSFRFWNVGDGAAQLHRPGFWLCMFPMLSQDVNGQLYFHMETVFCVNIIDRSK